MSETTTTTTTKMTKMDHGALAEGIFSAAAELSSMGIPSQFDNVSRENSWDKKRSQEELGRKLKKKCEGASIANGALYLLIFRFFMTPPFKLVSIVYCHVLLYI